MLRHQAPLCLELPGQPATHPCTDTPAVVFTPDGFGGQDSLCRVVEHVRSLQRAVLSIILKRQSDACCIGPAFSLSQVL